MLKDAVLLCTFGTEPQVLTLSLTALLRERVPIREAVVLYSKKADSSLISAVKTIRESWPGLPFSNSVKLRLVDIPINDIDSARSLKTAYRFVSRELRAYKERGWCVHLNISGGRKPIALCAFIAAQFLFSDCDHLWYLFSDRKLVDSRRLLPESNDRYRLIELPVPRWTESAPLLAALSRYDDPWAVSMLQRDLVHVEERKRWEIFLKHILTPIEREVVMTLVRYGGTNRDLGDRLHKSPRTIEHQLANVFGKLRDFLNWPYEISIDRTLLVALLSPYVRGSPLFLLGETPDDDGD